MSSRKESKRTTFFKESNPSDLLLKIRNSSFYCGREPERDLASPNDFHNYLKTTDDMLKKVPPYSPVKDLRLEKHKLEKHHPYYIKNLSLLLDPDSSFIIYDLEKPTYIKGKLRNGFKLFVKNDHDLDVVFYPINANTIAVTPEDHQKLYRIQGRATDASASVPGEEYKSQFDKVRKELGLKYAVEFPPISLNLNMPYGNNGFILEMEEDAKAKLEFSSPFSFYIKDVAIAIYPERTMKGVVAVASEEEKALILADKNLRAKLGIKHIIVYPPLAFQIVAVNQLKVATEEELGVEIKRAAPTDSNKEYKVIFREQKTGEVQQFRYFHVQENDKKVIILRDETERDNLERFLKLYPGQERVFANVRVDQDFKLDGNAPTPQPR